MKEVIRQRGMQDSRLEASKRNWRTGVTPTTDSDIRLRARHYMALVDNSVVATMALEGMRDGQGTPEMKATQTAQVRAGRREAVMAGFNLMGFDLVVKDKIEIIKQKAKEDQEDADLQASIGDPPVNWGNHAKRT